MKPLLFCLLSLAPALAADPPPATIEITGKANNETALRRIDSAGKIIIGREELDRYADSSIGEVLKRLPGVSSSGAPGKGGGIKMRGMGEGYTQIMLNGEPIARGFSLESLSPDAIERIEISRAPTAEHSARAIAGSINIVLRERVQSRQGQIKLGDQASGGRHTPKISLKWSDTSGRLGYEFDASHAQNKSDTHQSTVEQGQRAGQYYQDRNLQHSKESGSSSNLSPRINWKIDPQHSLSGQLFILRHQQNSLSDNQRNTETGPTANYQLTHSETEQRFQMLRGGANYRGQDDAGRKLEWRAGFNDNRSDHRSARQQSGGAGSETSLDLNHAQERGFTQGGKWTSPLGENHRLALGWDIEQSKRLEDRQRSLNGQPDPAASEENIQATSRRLAAFVQDDFSLSPQWSAYAGLRWEGIRTRSQDGGSNFSNQSSVWSPMLHSVYRLPGKDKHQLRASLSRSYKAPQTRELIARANIATDNSLLNPDRAGNPKLRPELAWGLDVAFEHYFSQGGLVSLGGFARSIDDLIRRETVLEADRYISRPRNISSARSYGLEFEAKLRLSEIMTDAPPLDLRLNLSRYFSAVAGISGPDNRLDEQPKLNANLGLDYKLRTLPLSFGSNFNWTPSYRVQVSNSEVKQLGAKRQLDAYASWRISNQQQLKLSVNNLLAQDYNNWRAQTGTQWQTVATTQDTQRQWSANWEVKF